jgi:DNA-binding GntR family transcriptional regulator
VIKKYDLANEIAGKIYRLEEGWRYGDKLPLGDELAKQFNTSYDTMSQVKKLLAEKKLLRFRGPMGTFVNYRPGKQR